MTELTIYSFRRCPFAIRVRMALEEKRLPYSVIEEDLSAPSADLLRHNPSGAVPVLIHGDSTFPESSVITEYLDETFPERPLMPRSAQARAQVRLWTLWCDNTLKPDLDAFKYQWAEISERDREALLERLKTHLGKMDSALENGPFILGQEFTLADIHLFPFYRQLRKARPDFSTLLKPIHLDAWLDRITTRPTFERVMAKRAPAGR